jgi:hypothetical protein
MALNIKIDFEDCYPRKSLHQNSLLTTFDTVLTNGKTVPIGINISEEVHPLIPNTYNFSFGPVGRNNQIDDTAKLYHTNHSRLFSTIVYCAYTFLKDRKDIFLGIDGSNNARAYMYYRCIQNNFDYLNQFLNIYGVKYYIRILRKENEKNNSHPVDYKDILAMPQIIRKEAHIKYEKLHNYFIFNAK